MVDLAAGAEMPALEGAAILKALPAACDDLDHPHGNHSDAWQTDSASTCPSGPVSPTPRIAKQRTQANQQDETLAA
jgi:hypothetical protein